ncbi:MAG: uroporphyrinogen-III synthase, partial [Desulfobacterales bacterium]|nr:uroporphyrinogen-III synthase [Desulfobacterales bacterium]
MRVAPPEDPGPLERAIDGLRDYDWIVFTSVNGVTRFFERLFARGRDARALGHLRTAAIGPVTAERLRSFGLTSDLVPETFQAEAVVEAFSRQALHGRRVLLPRAQEARALLPEQLCAMGASVHEVPVYRTLPADTDADRLAARLAERPADLLTFTSSSTVKNFKALLPPAVFQQV